MKAKTISESKTTMTELIMPNDTNPLGNLMGGNLMRWMDIAAGICAAKHCENHVVTASVDHISFRSPISIGEVITINASVTRAFNTSVEVYLEVFASDLINKKTRKSNHAFFTFVALESNKPTKVGPVSPVNEEEQKLYESAIRRRELRLVLSGRMTPAEATEIRSLFDDLDNN